MRVAPQVVLTGGEQRMLSKYARGRSTPARLVLRAKLVLLAAEGKTNLDFAAELGTTKKTVGMWRQRLSNDDWPGSNRMPPVRAASRMSAS